MAVRPGATFNSDQRAQAPQKLLTVTDKLWITRIDTIPSDVDRDGCHRSMDMSEMPTHPFLSRNSLLRKGKTE